MTIEDLEAVIEDAKERALESLLKTEDDAEELAYPRYGYTTAQVIETPEEYIEFWNEQIAIELEESAQQRFEQLLDWITS